MNSLEAGDEALEAVRIVLKRSQSASPKHLALLHHIQPLRPRLIALLQRIVNRVDEHERRVNAKLFHKFLCDREPILVRARVLHVGEFSLRVALRTKMPAIRWVGLRHVDNFVIDALGICGCDAGNAAERLGEWRSGARPKIHDEEPFARDVHVPKIVVTNQWDFTWGAVGAAPLRNHAQAAGENSI